MADLGVIGGVVDPTAQFRAERIPISDYLVKRGNFLGMLPVRDGRRFEVVRIADVGGYVVRQIRVLYRQLWPTHGQRFPQ